MRGYPKRINTKKDLLIALELDPARAKRFIEDAIYHRDGWHVTISLDSEAEGIVDDRHRVVDLSDEDSESDWYQEEYGPVPGNLLDRLGVTVSEAETYIEK